MNYQQTVCYVYKLERLGWIFGLGRIKRALEKLGNPQQSLRYVHAAGSNGKGSVVAMLSSILMQAGHSVATYTSPHLVDVRERITFNSRMISKPDFVKLAAKVRQTKVRLTFFEFLTAMAFLYFSERKPDYVLLEAGLGGRLDATNVITPEIAVITKIALEHTDILGSTVGKIAKEKAGIIKPGCTVVTGANGAALKVIRKTCNNKKCKLILAKPVNYKLSLKGDFQKFNAGIAAAAARELKIQDNHIRQGLARVVWSGRLERRGNVLLDCAHNPDGIKAMSKFVEKLKYKRLIVVFGCLADKDYRQMYRLLPRYDVLILTKPSEVRRALEPSLISKKHKIIKNPKQAVKYAKSVAGKGELILICGSIYLIGEIMGVLKR
jgi:dihydrofolate synthase / folylpolyglutamate synthase